jgi:hypothetical protein
MTSVNNEVLFLFFMIRTIIFIIHDHVLSQTAANTNNVINA